MERTVTSRRAYDGRLISLRVDDVELPDGRRSSREIVEHPGAVGILAWDGERVRLVRQWRHATGRDLLEIPAGTLDPGEEPLVTAQRELAEECGLAADRWRPGPRFFTAPGFCTEELSLFLATGLRDEEAEGPDDEAIEVERPTLSEALAAVDEGRIVDAKSVAGILWLARELAR